jgi:hypothetical protein
MLESFSGYLLLLSLQTINLLNVLLANILLILVKLHLSDQKVVLVSVHFR